MINKIPPWLFFVVIFVIWGGTLCLPAVFFSGEVDNVGVAGDMFGAANALFSGLAFACLILALRMQRDELALQREELRDTREEFAKQTEIHSAHLAILNLEKSERERLQSIAFEPYLMLRPSQIHTEQVFLHLINARATIFDLKILNPQASIGGLYSIGINDDTYLEKGGHGVVNLVLTKSTNKAVTYTFDLEFTTGLNEKKSVSLSILIDHSGAINFFG